MHIDIADPMPVNSAGGREYLYVIVDDFTRTVNAKPLRLQSEAVEAFKALKAESGEVLTDNACEDVNREHGDSDNMTIWVRASR